VQDYSTVSDIFIDWSEVRPLLAKAADLARDIFTDQVAADQEQSDVFLGPAVSKASTWLMQDANPVDAGRRAAALLYELNRIATCALYGWVSALQNEAAKTEATVDLPSFVELAKHLIDHMPPIA